MQWTFLFFANSVLFGVGLAMDAFSVSMANGLNEPKMSPKRMCGIAGTFALFQIAMPLIGWLCVHTIANLFTSFQKLIPWIALVLLLYIGGKMLLEGLRRKDNDTETPAVGFWALMLKVSRLPSMRFRWALPLPITVFPPLWWSPLSSALSPLASVSAV